LHVEDEEDAQVAEGPVSARIERAANKSYLKRETKELKTEGRQFTKRSVKVCGVITPFVFLSDYFTCFSERSSSVS